MPRSPGDAESEATAHARAQAEARVLGTAAGQALLAEVAAASQPGPAELTRWRAQAPPECVAAALRLAECRRRALGKFTRAREMWLDPVGLEQATAEAVARHKARRFTSGTVVDLCCGVGGDTLALAGRNSVLAVDRDAGMARRCAWNAGVYGVASRVLAVRARAERVAVPPGALVHVDPDRRAADRGDRARRALRLGGYEPGLAFLHELAATAPAGAIKLGPASDFESHFGSGRFEVELVSLHGECKEATVWFGALAQVRRRASVLPAGATWTDRDAPPAVRIPAGPAAVSAWVFSPDPALVRAGLLDGFAAAHGLGRVNPAADFLTGPARVSSPFLSAFEVIEALPVDLKRMRAAVSRWQLGPLEIKVRGLNLRPETLRRRLRPPGPNPGTLLLAGGNGPAQAILARRLPAPGAGG